MKWGLFGPDCRNLMEGLKMAAAGTPMVGHVMTSLP